jgi:PAS domain S-box-containing protein
MSSEDNTERFELWKHEHISDSPSLSEAALLLSRLQQSVRLLSGDLNQDSLRKVLRSVGRETATLAQIFTATALPLMSALTASVGKLVMKASGDAKTLDPSTLRTLTHAFDCLRSYSTDKGSHVQLQRLPIHVLVLDDDTVHRKIMERALGAEFMSLVLCETAEHALNCLKDFRFDVVLSDISMPEVDGFAFIQQLRQINIHARTPVIFITGHDDLLTRSKSRLTGGCDFMAKPIKPAELIVKAITYAWRSRLSRGTESIEPTPQTLPPTPPGDVSEEPASLETRSRVGVLSVSPDGLIQSISRDGASILGYSAEELVNAKASRLLSEPCQAGEAKGLTVDWLAEQAQRGTATQVLGRHKTGESYSMQIRVSRSGKGNAAPFVCLFRAN